jgi:eukaryotic-like serine/threonine-protein kinase
MELINQTITHYKILEKLGSGGMGIVYKSEDLKLHRTVALKFLPLEFSSDEEAKKRFIHEAQAASSLQHNNICTVHEIDETTDGQLFITMDYYEGETLKNKICRESLCLDEIIKITIQIAEGLCKAHENGIIHRDIKSANIFITKEGTVKILDFGLAKKLDQTQVTRIGTKIGTTDYMSPEQIKGEKVDQRTDIWSLGVLLYEMLTGQLPFKADYEQAIIYLILNQEPEDVRKFRKDVSHNLQTILEKAIAKDREDRYKDIAYLLEELKHMSDESNIQTSQIKLPSSKSSQSVAVLPFVNLSSDPEQDYFCDGLAEELINSLSKIRDIKVIARTSAFSFKGGNLDVRKIGRKLNVGAVLEGSVRKSGNNVRITAQLVNVMDGCHLWSDRYDREFNDVFNIQDEITLAIVNNLKVNLLGEEKERLLKRYTQNPEAYNLYLQGRYIYYQLNFNIMDKAIEYFHQALEKDPNYALAYHGLAYSYTTFAHWGLKRPSEVLPDIKKYIQKALEIDENLGEAYGDLATVKFYFEWKWSEVESAFLHSLELNPNNMDALFNYALYLLSVKRFDDAQKVFDRHKNIDPLSDLAQIGVLLPDFYNSKFDLVITEFSKYLDWDPPFWVGLWGLWRTLSLMGSKEEALKAFKKLFLLRGMNDIVKSMEGVHYEDAVRIGAHSMAEIYQHQFTSPYDIAMYFIHAGEKEEAITWLEKAVEDLDVRLYFLDIDPEWQSMHRDERFLKLLKKMGFKT